jgi:hypothetical protein
MPRAKIIYRRLGKKAPSHSRPKKTPFGLWKGDVNFRPVGGEIFIDPRQDEEEMLDTAVHELLHDAAPYLEEYAVEVYGSHISDALWKMGWRLTNKPTTSKPPRRK